MQRAKEKILFWVHLFSLRFFFTLVHTYVFIKVEENFRRFLKLKLVLVMGFSLTSNLVIIFCSKKEKNLELKVIDAATI